MSQDSGKERRRSSRFDTDAKIEFQVMFDIRTKVNFQIREDGPKGVAAKKYSAVSKNVSVEGLAFQSPKDLMSGDKLMMEVFVPSSEKPVHMEGEVRWCTPTGTGSRVFDTGVKISMVENTPVEKTIVVDSVNKVIWSIVLESVFGSFKHLMMQRS